MNGESERAKTYATIRSALDAGGNQTGKQQDSSHPLYWIDSYGVSLGNDSGETVDRYIRQLTCDLPSLTVTDGRFARRHSDHWRQLPAVGVTAVPLTPMGPTPTAELLTRQDQGCRI